jgi:hypothetical protein
LITKEPFGPDIAVVLAVSADANDNTITKLGLVIGTFTVGAFLDGAIAKTITVYVNPEATFNAQSGLCLDPIYNFDDYVNNVVSNSQKLKIDTPNVFLQTVIIYYVDGTTRCHRKVYRTLTRLLVIRLQALQMEKM